MNLGNLKCSLGCQNIEDQCHIFEKCPILNTKEEQISLEYIFLDTVRQKEAITKILRIESQRLKIKQALESQQSEEQQALSGATVL